ncbi:MAG: gluconate 2-dehydrogenase subunit 3 family protein [Rhizomicrobium sp.]
MTLIERMAPARRGFLGGVGALTGILMLRSARAGTDLAGEQPAALLTEEMDTLVAALGRLLPGDASSGGAVEARAQVYIDRALAGAYAKDLPVYRAGLAAIAVLAKRAGADKPGALPPAALDAILTRLDEGAVLELLGVVTLADGGKHFFRLLHRHMLEGTFGDPVHGGNYEFIGWNLIGYRGLQFNYSEAEQEIDGAKPAGNRTIGSFGRSPV